MQHAYVTYFDRGYLPRGLVLIKSLRDQGDFSDIWVLCLDSVAEEYFKNFPLENVYVFSVSDLVAVYPLLNVVKLQRSLIEFYFTCTPLVIKHVLSFTKYYLVVYVDADLYFFGDPAIPISELGAQSVGIIEHRYPKRLEKRLLQFGIYNVGWVAFKDDVKGNKVLDWWADSCLEWCFDRVEGSKYADQGYLNQFPDFESVIILKNPGYNSAPWNSESLQIQKLPSSKDVVFVDKNNQLVFFHFHGIREYSFFWILGEQHYGSKPSKSLKKFVYSPYLSKLRSAESLVSKAVASQKSAQKLSRIHLTNGFSKFKSRTREFINAFSGGATIPKQMKKVAHERD